MNRSIAPDDDAWISWHPTELADRLRLIAKPWCVVGGWALDLWHGEQTRDHDDLEFAVLREDFCIFRQALDGMDLYTVDSGRFALLPTDNIPAPPISQIWCLDRTETCWRVDLMFEPGSPETWVYKRNAGVTRPRSDMVATTADGVPYLKPAGVLLFKAKHQRPKDEIDFKNALPKLPATERHWLKHHLTMLHAGHPWDEWL